MKTEEQIREMKEILYKEIDLLMEQGKTIEDVEMQNLHSMLGMIHLILDDKRFLVHSEDYKNLYWFIDLRKRFVISSTVDKDRTSDKERKEEGNYFKTKAEAFFVLMKLRTDLIENKGKQEEK